MSLPDQAIRKAIANPSDVLTYVKNQVIEQNIITPIYGRYLFDHEWDLAIILDACRYDVAKSEIGDHELDIGEPKKIYSVASNSALWIERTFTAASSKQLNSTGYISGNVFTNRAPSKKLGYIDRIYEYAWNNEKGCVPPRPITDSAINSHRNSLADKHIVHYMQPHLPPLNDAPYEVARKQPVEGKHAAPQDTVWNRMQRGEINPDAVFQSYKQNLNLILDELEILLDNIHAPKVVITSDHGNYFGENNKWGHPDREIGSAVRHVPWWTTHASDNHTHEPIEHDNQRHVSREEMLKSLGYM